MSAAITPEQLAQLKRDAAGFAGTFLAHGGDDVHVLALVFAPADAPPPDASDFRDHAYVLTEDVDEPVAEALARLLNAVPALLAEVSRLRSIVDMLSRLPLDESTMTRAQLLCLLADLREQAGLPRVL